MALVVKRVQLVLRESVDLKDFLAHKELLV